MSSKVRISALLLFLSLSGFCGNRDASAAEPSVRRRAILPVWIDNQDLQDSPAEVRAGDQEVFLDTAALIRRLQESAKPEAWRPWQSNPWVSLSELRSAGLEAGYDESTLEVRIQIPALLRKTSSISMTRRSAPTLGEKPLPPSAFSAYANAFLQQDLVYGQSDAQNGRQPLRAALEAAANLHSWVAETQAGLVENGGRAPGESGAPVFRRGDARLVRDDPDRMVRYSLGDVQFPVSGFQRSRAIGGLSAASNFNLQPYRITSPISTYEIFLARQSTVKVLMNGRALQTLVLPPGRHDLRELPFSVGVNDVTLEITDDVGRTEIVRVPYVFSDQLLAPGIHQLAYAVGMPSSTSADFKRTYNGTNPTASLSHRFGATNRLTLGGFAQTDRSQGILGTSTVLASPLGNFNLELAGSRRYGSAPGLGTRLSYLLVDYNGPQSTARNLGFSIESQFPRFSALGELRSSEQTSHLIAAAYSQMLFARTSAGLTSTFQLDQTPGDSQLRNRTFALNLSRTWVPGLDTTLNFSISKDATAGSRNSAFFLFTWAFPEKNQYVNLTANSEDRNVRGEWNYSSVTHAVGGIQATVGASRSGTNGNDSARVDGKLDYTGNRARLGVSHESNRLAGASAYHRSELRMSTALAFAGGKLALSRPIADSFALVSAEGTLSDQTVYLNPGTKTSGASDSSYYEARTDWSGSASLPELTSYRYNPIHLTLSDLRPGNTLEKENFQLIPSYRSGTLIRLGREPTVFVRGVLRSAEGAPLALWSGELRSLTNPGFAPAILFTNREGRFNLEALPPGSYRAESFGEDRKRIDFHVPESAREVYDLGEVHLE